MRLFYGCGSVAALIKSKKTKSILYYDFGIAHNPQDPIAFECSIW